MRFAALLSAAAVLGACQVSPERCDPNQPYPGQSVVCQGQYEARLEAAQEAHWQASSENAQARQTQRDLSQQAEAVGDALAREQRDLEALGAQADELAQRRPELGADIARWRIQQRALSEEIEKAQGEAAVGASAQGFSGRLSALRQQLYDLQDRP